MALNTIYHLYNYVILLDVYFFSFNFFLQWPANYDSRAQETDKGWHIFFFPYKELAAYESPNGLLCVHS
jgi:hypothetical protein